MRSVLAHGWALGGLGIGPEGGHMVLGNDAGLRGEMGSMLEMSGLGGAHACLMGVSRGSWYCRWGAIQGSIRGRLHFTGQRRSIVRGRAGGANGSLVEPRELYGPWVLFEGPILD